VSSWRDLSSRSPLLGACGISSWSFPSGLLLVELSNGICPRSRGDFLAESSFEGFRSLSLVSPLGGAPRELFTEGLPNRMPSNGTSSLGTFGVFAAECSSGIALQGVHQREPFPACRDFSSRSPPLETTESPARTFLRGCSYRSSPTGVFPACRDPSSRSPPLETTESSYRGLPSGLLLPEFANGSLPCLQGSLLAESSSGDDGILLPGLSFGAAPTGVRQRESFLLAGIPPRGVLLWKCSGSSDWSLPSGPLLQEFANGSLPPGFLLAGFSWPECSGLFLQELSFRDRPFGSAPPELFLREKLTGAFLSGPLPRSSLVRESSDCASRSCADRSFPRESPRGVSSKDAFRSSRLEQTGTWFLVECSPESPSQRRSTVQSSPSGVVCIRVVRQSRARRDPAASSEGRGLGLERKVAAPGNWCQAGWRKAQAGVRCDARTIRCEVMVATPWPDQRISSGSGQYADKPGVR
jgi:hypothetical protein